MNSVDDIVFGITLTFSQVSWNLLSVFDRNQGMRLDLTYDNNNKSVN